MTLCGDQVPSGSSVLSPHRDRHAIGILDAVLDHITGSGNAVARPHHEESPRRGPWFLLAQNQHSHALPFRFFHYRRTLLFPFDHGNFNFHLSRDIIIKPKNMPFSFPSHMQWPLLMIKVDEIMSC